MRTPIRHVPGPDPRHAWGHFEPGNEVFCVTSTDTPKPWTNLISNWTYGAFFTQHGMGFSFHVAPKICEVTRWSLNESRPAHFDATRHIWVRDLDSGRYWPGNPQPGEQDLYRQYRCRVGLGWSEVIAEREGLDVRFRFFVPLVGNLELWTVTVTNAGRHARKLAFVPVVELPTRGTYIRSKGAWNRELQAVRAYQPGDAGWRREDAHVFFGLDKPVRAWDVSRAAFRGPRDDPRRPAALERGLTRSTAENEYMVAGMEIRATIRPGQSFTFNGILGYAVRDAEAGAYLRKYRRPGAVDAAFRALVRDWKKKLDRARCELPDANVGRYLAVWGKYAVARTSQLSRSQRIGYRDVLQDLRGYLIADPPRVREKILWLFGYVRKDGSSVRGINPVGDRHDADDIRDNPLWGVELVNAYVKETGDLAILKESVPWLDGGKGTLWEHLVKVATRLVPLRGRHGITLVACGDWNDALGQFGKEGRGESAWLHLLVIRNLRFLAELAEATGRKAEAKKYRTMRADMARAFNRSAWDGDWYVYGWDDDGVPIGSRRSPEGKIHANVQTWALMERVAPSEREAKLWRVIERYLWTDLGLLTTQPAYVRTQPTGSYIQKLAPGTYENAAVYCHGTAFYMAACAAAGRGDQALAAAVAALPTNPKNHRCDLEPYGTTNFYVGPDSKHFGRAPHSWFTGSAAWFLFVGWEGLLGIQPEFDGLRLAPCVPRSWTNWRVTREFRGACYEMTFRKPRGSKGLTVKRLVVDGKDVSGNIVPILRGGTHRVEVELA